MYELRESGKVFFQRKLRKDTRLSLKQSTILQIILNDDVGDSVEYELNVVRVGGAGEVCVDLFLIFPLVEILEFHSYVARCFFI